LLMVLAYGGEFVRYVMVGIEDGIVDCEKG
jgi:hypothetical protein